MFFKGFAADVIVIKSDDTFLVADVPHNLLVFLVVLFSS